MAQILINDHPDLLNTPDANGVTPIFYAAIHGHTDLVQALAKENPELLLSKNSDGVPLIRFVALSGNTELVEALAKDHPLTANSDVLTLIDLAAFTGNTKLVQALSKYSPELLLSKNSDGLTPVHLAAFGGHTDLVQVLIKDPAIQQKMSDILGFATETMLANFIKAGVELSQEFIQTKLNLSYTNKKGESNLHLAIHGGNSKTIKALIDSGADYTQVNLLDQTPLDIAIISGNLDTLKVFLDHNPALLTQKNAKGLTPLDLATTLNNEEMVQELLKRAANIDALTQYGATTASLAPTASTTKKSLVPEGGRLSAIIKAAKEMKPHIVHSTDLPPTSTPTATSVTQTAKKIATEALGPSRTLERTTSVEDGVGAKRRDDAHTRRASEGDHNHF